VPLLTLLELTATLSELTATLSELTATLSELTATLSELTATLSELTATLSDLVSMLVIFHNEHKLSTMAMEYSVKIKMTINNNKCKLELYGGITT